MTTAGIDYFRPLGGPGLAPMSNSAVAGSFPATDSPPSTSTTPDDLPIVFVRGLPLTPNPPTPWVNTAIITTTKTHQGNPMIILTITLGAGCLYKRKTPKPLLFQLPSFLYNTFQWIALSEEQGFF